MENGPDLAVGAATAVLRVMPYLAQATDKATRDAATLSPAQAGMLFMLTERPLRGSEIAARWGVSRAAITEAAQRMEKKRLIRRTRDRTDGRSFLFHLTARGQRELERFGEVAASSVLRQVGMLDEDEQVALQRACDRLFDIFEETFE